MAILKIDRSYRNLQHYHERSALNNTLRTHSLLCSLYRALGLLCLSMLAMCYSVSAQHTSAMGRFSVDNAVGCAPLQVNVTEHDNLGNVTRQYWYEDKSNAPVTNKSYRYTTPGEYYLVQLVGANVPEKEDSIKIIVHDPTPPEFKIHNCAGHVVRVEITDTNYDSYRIDFTPTDSEVVQPGTTSPAFDYGAAGDYPITVTGLHNGATDNCGSKTQTITTIDAIVPPVVNSVEMISQGANGSLLLSYTIGDGSDYYLQVKKENSAVGFDQEILLTAPVSLTIQDINTRDSYFCYRIRTFDACNNAFIYSNVICSSSIDVKAENGQNNIVWKTQPGLANSYRVIRNGEVMTEITDTQASTFEDTDILCGNDYCYRVQAIYDQGTSVSYDSCVVAIKVGDLPALENVSSTIENEQVVLNWSQPDPNIQLSQYIVKRSVGTRPYSTLTRTFDNTYADDDITFRNTLRYLVQYQDNCGNTSIATEVNSPVILQIGQVNGNEVTLEWNKYETWTNGVRTYFIERLDENGSVTEEYSVLSGRSKSITFASDDDQPKNLRVRAESLDSPPLISHSNVRTVVINPLINLPTAFTPDDDGLNDEFKMIGSKVFNFSMRIYSRWGDEVFSSLDANVGWDGRINGNRAPEGTYTYRIRYEDATGRSFDKSGAVMLIRFQ